tara:strand:- start:29 stop:991 length:963 start_codon:yes stop_codon:yes gene_type:complete
MYETNKGIRLDLLYTLANTDLDTNRKETAGTNPLGPGPEFYGSKPPYSANTGPTLFVATSTLSGSVFTSSSALSSTFSYEASGADPGIEKFELFDKTLIDSITSFSSALTAYFKSTTPNTMTFEGSASNGLFYQNVFDYDIMDYRKVVDVTDFDEGSTTGINTLFTLEQTLAQQTYFSYAMGNYGFDLVSWYTLKEWIDLREKVLATKRDIKFDPRTQYLQMYPQPQNDRFYGVISCFLEKPIRDVIMEQWIYEYSLALSMITIGRVRGKFGQVALLGGGALNYDMITKGEERKAELEEKLLTGASPGLGDTDPPMFFVG